jgi:hypothetical protein
MDHSWFLNAIARDCEETVMKSHTEIGRLQGENPRVAAEKVCLLRRVVLGNWLPKMADHRPLWQLANYQQGLRGPFWEDQFLN